MTPEQVQAKLSRLVDEITKLRALPTQDLKAFREDDRTLDAALRRLEVAIQILIDVGSHVVVRLGLGAPDSSRDVLARLEQHGALPPGSTEKFGRIFAFRNRIVHLYDRVDDEQVFDVVANHVVDLEELGRRFAGLYSESFARRP